MGSPTAVGRTLTATSPTSSTSGDTVGMTTSGTITRCAPSTGDKRVHPVEGEEETSRKRTQSVVRPTLPAPATRLVPEDLSYLPQLPG